MSPLTSNYLDAFDASCDLVGCDSTTKLKPPPRSTRRARGSGDEDPLEADEPGGAVKAPSSPPARTSWSKVHQCMLVGVFLVGFLFAVVVGAAYLLDADQSDNPNAMVQFRPPPQTARANISTRSRH